MGNWLSAEPGMSPADIDHNPSGQRDDNRRGGEEAVEKGRNRTAEGGYSGARPWGFEPEDDDSATRPVIDQQPTGATLLPSTHDHIPATAPHTNVAIKTLYQIPSLFSPIHPIDSAYGTGPVTALYCFKTLPTFVTARKTPVSFADDDVVIPPSKTVDPAKLDDKDSDAVVETCSETSDEFVAASPVRQSASSTRLHRRELPRRRDTKR